MRIDSDQKSAREAVDDRRVWVAPHYAKMEAGDAEQGPNPDNPDVGFTFS